MPQSLLHLGYSKYDSIAIQNLSLGRGKAHFQNEQDV